MKKSTVHNIGLLALVLILEILYLGITQVQRTSPDGILTRSLQAQGFREISTTPAAAGYCKSGENAYSFHSITSNGQPVNGIVCTLFFPAAARIIYK
jgi:hypothetical protein